MNTTRPPRHYPEWSEQQCDRQEDAADLFGYYLIMHCRDEAMATLQEGMPSELKAAVERAVDVALHNVCDMLEGFWILPAGPNHTISLDLSVQFRDAQHQAIEAQQVSPCILDLPIVYWKWAKDREFR